MAQTVIGFFKDPADAQKAVQRLAEKGITEQNVDVSRGEYLDGTADADGRNTNRVTDFFNKLFGHDSDDAKRYSTVGQSNMTIVTVHAQSHDQAEAAADVLDDCGAVDVDEHASQSGYSASSGTGAPAMGGASTEHRTTGEGQSIPVIQENLEVGKRQEQTGGVRVRSRIVEQPVEEHIRLRDEQVTVERNPVNRAASEADFQRAGNQEIQMREQTEVPVVHKEARVVEEVRVGKTTEERDETIHETLRNTDVDVENTNRNTTGGTFNSSTDNSLDNDRDLTGRSRDL